MPSGKQRRRAFLSILLDVFFLIGHVKTRIADLSARRPEGSHETASAFFPYQPFLVVTIQSALCGLCLDEEDFSERATHAENCVRVADYL